MERGPGTVVGIPHFGDVVRTSLDLLVEPGELLVGDPEFPIQCGDVSLRRRHGRTKGTPRVRCAHALLFEGCESDRHVADPHTVLIHIPGHVAREPEEV